MVDGEAIMVDMVDTPAVDTTVMDSRVDSVMPTTVKQTNN